MGKFLEPDPDVYNPADEPGHPWADLFRDIPRKWQKVPAPEGVTAPEGLVFAPAGPGTITLPTTPADLARHAQLCGFKLDESARQVRRVDPVRGGKSFTSPGIWQDRRLPVPEGDPVNVAVQTALGQNMTAAELKRTADALAQAAELQARSG